ncbi:MFS transporter small subunit [Phaeodactylibacter luteus]
MSTKESKLTSGALLAWLFVGIPLLWGITQTLIKSMALFN